MSRGKYLSFEEARKYGQLAENIINYVKDKPKLQGESVQGPLINYLIELCGAPPEKAK
jgi:hypothetical protein